MPVFPVHTSASSYLATVENGIAAKVAEFVPKGAGKVFVVSTEDVMRHAGAPLKALSFPTLLLPGGEDQKRLAPLEALAEQMVRAGADRTSVIIGFGGGIVTDMAGFLAAIFLRGIPVIQVPTTLLAQVDAAIGGKTGVNLEAGKNLIGSFHQPLAVLIDPALLATLPEREYRAGLYEVIKSGVIASTPLFDVLDSARMKILSRDPETVEWIIAECVRIKAEVVTADEKELGIRKILNFGHTVGHALEAETKYLRFLHGEAVAFGMIAAARLAQLTGECPPESARQIEAMVRSYGPIPPLEGVTPEALLNRLGRDKKTIQGRVHFVLPTGIGHTKVVSGIPDEPILSAIQYALALA